LSFFAESGAAAFEAGFASPPPPKKLLMSEGIVLMSNGTDKLKKAQRDIRIGHLVKWAEEQQ
jgi:hypothetical protein